MLDNTSARPDPDNLKYGIYILQSLYCILTKRRCLITFQHRARHGKPGNHLDKERHSVRWIPSERCLCRICRKFLPLGLALGPTLWYVRTSYTHSNSAAAVVCTQTVFDKNKCGNLTSLFYLFRILRVWFNLWYNAVDLPSIYVHILHEIHVHVLYWLFAATANFGYRNSLFSYHGWDHALATAATVTLCAAISISRVIVYYLICGLYRKGEGTVKSQADQEIVFQYRKSVVHGTEDI